MRSSVLILLLLVALGLGLGLRSWLLEPAARSNGREPASPAAVAAIDDAAAPADPAPAPEPVPQGHVYAGVSEQPNNVNPLAHHSTISQRILSYTHDTLLDSDPATGELRAAIASAWAPSADGGSCTFTLRDGVHFADGSPMTMDDVLFGWRVASAGALALGAAGLAFDRVAAVDVLDERRFCVHFRDRHYAAVRVVGENWPVVCRRWFVDRVAALADRAGGAAPPAEGTPEFALLLGRIDSECGPGTGPYELRNEPGGASTWQPGRELTLVRNEHSWRRTARPGTWNFAGIRFLFLDGAAAFNALLRGEVDWYSSPGIDDLLATRPAIGESFRRVEYDYRQLGAFVVAWNCRRPPFDDRRVRRALASLFDLERIVEVFGGHCEPAFAYAKPGSPEYPRDVAPFGFDVARARTELRELGFGADLGRPLRLVLLVPERNDVIRRTIDLFADAARQAGLDLDVRVREWSVFVTEMNRREWDALIVHQSFRPWGDPYDFVHSEGQDNHGDWSHPDADRLATAARGELDRDRRTQLLRELHELVFAEQPVAFLVHPRVTLLLNRHVEGAEPGPLGLSIEHAFVRPEHQRR